MTSGLLASVLLAAASSLLLMSSGRLRRTPRVPDDDGGQSGIGDAPLILDLLAAVLSSGASVEGALLLVADSCELPIRAALARVHGARLLGASWEASWEVGMAPVSREADTSFLQRLFARRPGRDFRTLAEIQQGLRFAVSTGAPSAALLHAHAAQLRRRHNREVDRKAAALGVQLVLPLGVCSLPAFICLGVVPIVLGLLPAL